MSTVVIAEEQISQIIGEPSRCQCSECVNVRSQAIKLPAPTSLRRGKYSVGQGSESHDSGTIIHWNWRDLKCPKLYVLITCHGCDHDSFVQIRVITRIYKGKRCWKGLCSKCSRNIPLHKKFKGEYTNPFGAKIDFDKSPHDRNKYWVYCPNYSTCGGFEQRRVDKYNIDTQPFYCSKCLSNTRRSRISRAWLLEKGENGSGQKNGGAEKVRVKGKRGPKPKITEEKIREAFKTLGQYAPQEK